MTQQKIKELKQSLNIEFQLIHELCIYVLSASQRTDLIRVTLATLHAFLSWIPLGYIFESPLLETLLKFFSLLPYRNLTFQCLAEVAALNFGYYYNPQYVNMYSIFMLQLQTILPSIVKIPEIYAHGSSEDQAFIQNLALFFTSFFKCHIRVLESTQANISALLMGLEYLIGISYVDDTEVFKLSSAGIIRLPRFEMAMAKSEANNKPVLAAEDVQVVTVYGRIYCLQVDRVAMLLHSYRFYRDAVVQQGSFPVYSSKIAVSVVDNVLLVHQVDPKVVILYDVFTDSRAPISAPLPLLFRGFHRASVSSSHSSSNHPETLEEKDLTDTEAIIYGDDWIFLVPDLICDVANGFLWKTHLDLEAITASSSEVPFVLEFLQRRKLEAKKAKQLCLAVARNIILERRPVSMVTRSIDVLVTSYSYSIKTGSYLKGMKLEMTSSSGATNVNIPEASDTVANASTSRVDAIGKSVKHEPASGVVNESISKLDFSTLDSDDSANFERQKNNPVNLHSSGGDTDRENLMGAEANNAEVQPASQSQIIAHGNHLLNDNISELQESQINSAAITPDEMYSFVFAPVVEEMGGDASYLVSIVVEFLCSSNIEKVKVHPNVHVLTVRLLARNERYSELGLFITNKILEPSKEVALQLLESGRQNSPTRKLGLDMLRQLLLHHDYVVLLVQNGYYLEALRYAQKNKVNTVRPSLFLEAAYASNDSQHLTAVLRFFSDFIPGFRNTSDHNSYIRVLAEMSSSIVV